jgi:hypothetical protein
MLNDAVWNISDLDKIPEQDGYNLIPVIVSIPFYLVKQLSVSCRDNPDTIKIAIKEYLDTKELQHHSASLSFNGKKPRRDQLEKLLKISEESESYPDQEKLKRWQVVRIIKEVLNNPDERTIKKYLNCIQNYVKVTTGREVYFNSVYDLFSLKSAVLYSINDLETRKEQTQ